jgi:hypothetical protein
MIIIAITAITALLARPEKASAGLRSPVQARVNITIIAVISTLKASVINKMIVVSRIIKVKAISIFILKTQAFQPEQK